MSFDDLEFSPEAMAFSKALLSRAVYLDVLEALVWLDQNKETLSWLDYCLVTAAWRATVIFDDFSAFVKMAAESRWAGLRKKAAEVVETCRTFDGIHDSRVEHLIYDWVSAAK